MKPSGGESLAKAEMHNVTALLKGEKACKVSPARLHLVGVPALMMIVNRIPEIRSSNFIGELISILHGTRQGSL